MTPQPPLNRALAGEVLGTYLLVLLGTGSVASALLSGAQVGLWQVAAVWGFGVTLAICVSAGLSGAHLNPDGIRRATSARVWWPSRWAGAGWRFPDPRAASGCTSLDR